MAIHNFTEALAINPRSAVLMCYLGMAQHKCKRTDLALQSLQAAMAADALNPLARYEYASVLISQDKFEEAIVELEKLKVCSRLDHNLILALAVAAALSCNKVQTRDGCAAYYMLGAAASQALHRART